MEESVDPHKEAGKENEQKLANLGPAEEAMSPRREANKFFFFCSFAFLFGHIINILLTELGRSVWENLDLGHW